MSDLLQEMDADLGGDTKGALEAAAARFGLRKTSGYRSPSRNAAVGGAPNSYHMRGQADDFAGAPAAMSSFRQYVKTGYGDQVAEAIHGSGDHRDHVHVAWKGPQKASLIDDMDRDLGTASKPRSVVDEMDNDLGMPTSRTNDEGHGQGARVQGLLNDLRAANPQDVSKGAVQPSKTPFAQEPQEIGITPIVKRVVSAASGSPRTPAVQPAQTNQPNKAALGLETAFNEARDEGDKDAMERYGRMLQKEGWEAGPGADGWWYVKPPSAMQRPESQGLTTLLEGGTIGKPHASLFQQVAGLDRQDMPGVLPKPGAPVRTHKPFRIPGVATVPAPIAEGAVDVASGLAAPIVRAVQGVYRLPGKAADELRRIPMGTDPTQMPEQPESQVRASYESNPVEQGVGKIATTIEEFAQQHGLPVGIAKELANAAGGLVPLLLLKNPAAIGGLTAAEAYGRGESLLGSLAAGAEQTAVMGAMGGGAKALDEVLSTPGVYKLMREAGASKAAARPAAVTTGTGGRLIGRTAVNVAAPNLVRATTGQEMHSVTPGEAVMGAGFALAHGSGERPDSNASRQAPRNAAETTGVRDVSQGQSPSELVQEPYAAISAQLQSLREQLGSRRAVLVPTDAETPVSRSQLENEGFAVTKTSVGTFIHDVDPKNPQSVSRKVVRQMAGDGTYHTLLGIIEPKSPEATEAVVARDESGTEIQAAQPDLIAKPSSLLTPKGSATSNLDAKPLEPGLHHSNYQSRDEGRFDGEPEYPKEDVRGAASRRAEAYDKLVALRRGSEEGLYQASNLSVEETDRVRAKFESLKKETGGRSIKTAVDDYLRQGGLFGHELNADQQELLRDLASPARRAANKDEQGGLFGDTTPTVESRREQSQLDKAGPTFKGGLFQGNDKSDAHALISNVIDSLVSEGVTTFKEAAQKFRDEFGPSAEYGDTFESAWDANKNVKKRGKETFDSAIEESQPEKRETLTNAVIRLGRLKSTGFSGAGEKKSLSIKEGGRLGLFSDKGARPEDMIGMLEGEGWNFDGDLNKFVDALRDEAGGNPHYGDAGAVEAGNAEVEREWERQRHEEFAENSDHSIMARAFDNPNDKAHAPWLEAFDEIRHPRLEPRPDDIDYFKEVSRDFGLSDETINRILESGQSARRENQVRDESVSAATRRTSTVPTDAASFKQGLVDHFKYSDENAETSTAIADALVNTLARESGKSKESWYKKIWIGHGGAGEGLEQKNPQTDTPEFKKWFGKSKVVDEKGDPLVVYHGTTANAFQAFNTANEGAHFGSRDQAKFAADQYSGRGGRRKVIPTFLSINNPLRLPDLGVWSNFDNVRSHLSVHDFITDAEADSTWNAWQQGDKQGWDALKAALRTHGYDGIVYTNGLEGKGDSYIAFEPTQIKSATDNRGTFDPNDSNILHQSASTGESQRIGIFNKEGKLVGTASLSQTSDPAKWVEQNYGKGYDFGPLTMDEGLKQEDGPAFYSQLQRTLESQSQPRFTPEQLEAVLRKSVKPDEMKWTGFDDFLAEKKAKGARVTKEEAVEFARQNAVEVREVTKSEGMSEDAVEERARLLASRATDETMDVLRTQARDQLVEENPDAPKFSQYQLPGGENYRELLLTLPPKPIDYAARKGAPLSPLEKYATDRLAPENTFKSSHFDEPNVLAHIRFNERTDSEGKRVLFIEEVQSDWHQKGRKEGYRTVADENQLQKAQARVDALTSNLHLSANDRSRLLNLDNSGLNGVSARRETRNLIEYQANRRGAKLTEAEINTEIAALRDAWRALEAAENDIVKYRRAGVPDAPFKTTWPELAMKRMIRWGAENGFDKVAWTTGEQQADRYDLSKQLDELDWTKSADGTYDLVGFKDGESVGFGRETMDLPASELESYVGKEIAQKIIDGKGSDRGSAFMISTSVDGGALSGLDLAVGGEGMKGFYDKILPSVAAKLGKKFGAKAGETEIPLGKVEITRVAFPSDAGPEWTSKKYAVKHAGEEKEFFATRREAVTYAETLSGRDSVHSLDITDSMRASAMQGQPLFQGAHGVTQFLKTGQAIIRALLNPNESTAIHEIHHWAVVQFMELAEKLRTDPSFLSAVDTTLRRATAEGAEPQLIKDMRHMSRWMGFRNAEHFMESHGRYVDGTLKGGDLKRYIDGHEKGARGFEKYMRTGKAPTPALEVAFAKFKEWLTDIYQTLKGSPIEFEPGRKQRAVWDRMLGGTGKLAEGGTQAKQETVQTERAQRGLPPIEKEAARRWPTVWEDAKKSVDADGGMAIRAMAEELARNPRVLSDLDQAKLVYDRTRLKNLYDVKEKEGLEAAKADDDAGAMDAAAALDYVEQKLLDSDMAIFRGKSEWGRSGAFSQLLAREDYTYERQVNRATIKKGENLISEEKRAFKDLSEKYEDLENKIKVRDAELESQRAYMTELQRQSLQRDKVQGWRAGNRKNTKRPAEAIDAEFANMQNQLARFAREANGLHQAADVTEDRFPPEIRKLIKDMARNRVEAGSRTAEDVNAEVHGIVRQYLPDVTGREVGDIWSDYGKSASMSKDEIDVAMREVKHQERLLASLEDAQKGVSPARSGLTRDKQSARVRELTKQVKQAMIDSGLVMEKGDSDPERQWQTALKSFKTRTENRRIEYQRRLDEGDFKKKGVRPEMVYDAEAMRLKSELAQVKDSFGRAQRKFDLANRSGPQKVADSVVKWSRGIVLSSVQTIGKLGSAVLQRYIMNPIESATGEFWDHVPVVRRISARAPSEGGGFNAHAEFAALMTVVNKSLYGPAGKVSTEAMRKLKTGKGAIDVMYGGKTVALDPEFIDYIAHAHGLMKTPAQVAGFNRAWVKNADFEYKESIRHGATPDEARMLVSEPATQLVIGMRAAESAYRDILMNDNLLVSRWRLMLHSLENIKGKGRVTGKVISAAAQIEMPIVKVPANYVAETANYLLGLPVGLTRAGYAAARSRLGNMEPEHADAIIRNLKKGTVGAALLAIGWSSPGTFGGFYQPGKRDEDDAQWGGMSIGGHNVPTWLLHSPAMNVLQFGATARRVYDKLIDKGDSKASALIEAAGKSGLGLLEEVPFLEWPVRTAEKLKEEHGLQKFVGEHVKRVVPPDVERTAKAFDPAEEGGAGEGAKRFFGLERGQIKREPENMLQRVLPVAAIPWLRPTVPEKGSKSRGSRAFDTGAGRSGDSRGR